MEKINYGIDAPTVIRNFFVISVLLLLAAFFLPSIEIFNTKFNLDSIALTFAIMFIIPAAAMLHYSKVGKFKLRERLLSLYNWKGNENVLDVGTGLGLLMIGAAKRLTTGKAIGIDIWKDKDLSNNTLNQAKQNAKLENVSDKIEILNQDIIKTSFINASFDVIVSNLCLHNIHSSIQREAACKEIFRILKKDAVAIISDIRYTNEYKKVFNNFGMSVEKIRTYYWDTFPPVTIIRTIKISV